MATGTLVVRHLGRALIADDHHPVRRTLGEVERHRPDLVRNSGPARPSRRHPRWATVLT